MALAHDAGNPRPVRPNGEGAPPARLHEWLRAEVQGGRLTRSCDGPYYLVVKHLSILALALLAITCASQAGEVYGNSTLGRPNGGSGASANFINQRFQAINFNTGTSSLLGIDEGWVLLRNSTGGSVNLTVDILANGSSIPTGLSLGSTTLTVANDGSDSWRHFSFSQDVELAAATDYWLVISGPSTVAVNWLKPNSTTSTYDAFNASGYESPVGLLRANSANGSSWNTGGPAEMGFQLGAVAVVPEPSTWALALTGTGLLGFATRRR